MNINLGELLRGTDADEVIIRTTEVQGGWQDVEFTASRAGFRTSRYFNPVYEARHEFSECYKFTRRK